ncbi:FAD-dependent monooxygenase [Streptomyces sp. NBC_00249]|uniref:FAD-dependent oxidoreductase n=1 Tax=Streptomyces sp. NBC_00249 TaxID=2975690 RepID=UPI00225B606C|nr:NAD(P)/FAD-dependent oxidoreductase [Streptomyces sp. NBC_00249]MCX5199133.1 FAD-dependent monooxygenase [Streptomyces sp. NBC_00249]
MNVIVIGAGVAGAATAIALRRLGLEVTVYEAYAEPAGQVGSFLSLASNGLRVLRSLGVLEEVQRAGIDVPRQRMWSGSGKLLGDVPRGRPGGDALHSVTLMRGALVEVLRAEAVAAGAVVVTGERLVDVTTVEEGGVRAEFASGRTARASLLVGADGIWSATRTLLAPHAPTPEYAGLYSISGVAEGIETPPGVFNLTFARGGAFLHLAAPGDRVWWSAQVPGATEPEPGLTDEERLQHLAGLYRHDQVPSAILAATTALHRPTPMHRLGAVPVRHDDRIVLIGDAAHPVGAGQGASMALEDALVLARSLAAEPSVAAALAAYEATRSARVATMVKASSDNRDAKTAGPLARRMRDLVMPLGIRLFYARATAWLYTHDCGELPAARPAADGQRRSGASGGHWVSG